MLNSFTNLRNLCTAVSMLAFSAHAAYATGEEAAYLNAWLNQSSLTFDTVHVSTEPLRPFYTARNYQLAWVDDQGLNAQGKKLFVQLSKVNAEGLNPALYHIDTLQRIAASDTDADKARHEQVRLALEVMMSNALLHYMDHMQTGVAEPQGDQAVYHLTEATKVSWMNQLALAENPDVMLQAIAPQSPAYTALKTALAQYQQIAANGGWPSFEVGKTIKPGMQDARLSSVQQILTATGDYANSSSIVDLTYHPALVEAVKRFQARHGIEADGVLGASTQQALAVPVNERIAQMQLTLERMRWLPRDMGNRYVLVNIPAYQLHAVNGADQLNMKVIVGKPATPTPLFTKTITNISFNPSWGVPAKIAVNEMLPKIRRDPNYLTNAGYTLSSNGQTVDPSSVDWSNIGKGYFPYSIRQNPGDGNALGKVKFFITDADDIYLHDTANRNLFAKSERSLSHGCVRLGDPQALAKFVLKGEGWSEQKIETAYESDDSRAVSVKPLPVYLVYWTSWVDGQGKPHFARDIYGKDKALMAALRNAPSRDTAVQLAMN